MFLAHIPALGGSTTLDQAIAAIFRRRDEKGLGTRCWSLAELHPDEQDYKWLCEWARALDGCDVRQWLGGAQACQVDRHVISRNSALGLLILFLCSEAARREATEGSLWPHAVHDADKMLRFSPSVKTLLFGAQNQPTEALKSVIETAVRRMNLRNVCGVVGTQEWYLTVYLQFGFTKRGFHAHLPHWLAGYQSTEALTALLMGESYSASFRALWTALCGFRHKNLSLASLQRIAQDSPWVLPDWIGDLVIQSHRLPHLALTAVAIPDTLPKTVSFLSEPRLQWTPPGKPTFVLEIQNLTDLDLDAPHYDILIAGKRHSRLLRQLDGSYQSLNQANPDRVVLAQELVSPTTLASLADDQGEVIQTQPLVLWEPGDDVNVFRMNGFRIADAAHAPLPRNQEVILLLSNDLTLTPAPDQQFFLPRHMGHLCRLTPGQAAEAEAHSDEHLIWSAVQQILPTSQPDWASQVHVSWSSRLETHNAEMCAWIKIGNAPDVCIQWVRANGQYLREQNGRYGPVPLLQYLTHQFTIAISTVDNDKSIAHIRQTLKTEDSHFSGAVRWNGQDWLNLDGCTEISVSQAKNEAFRLFPPVDWRRDPQTEWRLIEGDVYVGGIKQGMRPLGSLGGWGAKLCVWPRPFNGAMDALPLSMEVEDTGILTQAEWDTQQQTLRLDFPYLIEPSKDHSVWWWDRNSRIGTFPAELFTVSENGSWQIDALPEEPNDVFAVALTYRGERIGAWWTDDWCSSVLKHATDHPAQAAALLRFWKFPLLNAATLPQLREFLANHPQEAVKAWLSDHGMPEGLSMPGGDDFWNSALRTLLAEWKPDELAVRHFLREASQGQQMPLDEVFLNVATRFLRICPLVMGRVMEVAFLLMTQRYGHNQASTAFSRLCYRLVDLDPASPGVATDMQARKDLLRDEIAQKLGVNGTPLAVNFVTSRIGLVQQAMRLFSGQVLSDNEQTNLDVAMAKLYPLRLLIGIEIISTLI